MEAFTTEAFTIEATEAFTSEAFEAFATEAFEAFTSKAFEAFATEAFALKIVLDGRVTLILGVPSLFNANIEKLKSSNSFKFWIINVLDLLLFTGIGPIFNSSDGVIAYLKSYYLHQQKL